MIQLIEFFFFFLTEQLIELIWEKQGDLSIFKTKATLSKQNSLMPGKKEKEMESQRFDGPNGHDDPVNEGVHAGRYFATPRGPALDEIKVYRLISYLKLNLHRVLHI